MSSFVLGILILTIVRSTFSQNLEAIKTKSRLPHGTCNIHALYDESDSIYIIGGITSSGLTCDIVRYSIDSDTIQTVGTMENSAVLGGVSRTGNGYMYYFGGMDWNGGPGRVHTEIYKFEETNPSNMTIIGHLPAPSEGNIALWDNGKNVYLFGGHGGDSGVIDSILRFNSEDDSIVQVARLTSGRDGSSVIWNDQVAYIFGGLGNPTDSDTIPTEILKFEAGTNTVTKLEVTLPSRSIYSCAVWSGEVAYLIGGNLMDKQPNIWKFDPRINTLVQINVTGLPTDFFAAGCTYVEKLQRIYIFGGLLNTEYKFVDEILYVDLNGKNNVAKLSTYYVWSLLFAITAFQISRK